MIAFSIYCWSDLKRRETVAAKQRLRIRPVVEDAAEKYRRSQEELKKTSSEAVSKSLLDPDFIELAGLSDQMKLVQKVRRVGFLRIVVDAYFPVFAGLATATIVWASTGGFPGWRLFGVGAVFAGLLGTAALLWWRRRELRKWWRRKRWNRRSNRQKQLMKRAASLAPDDPMKAQLMQEARDLLMKSIRDMRDGMF